MKSDNASTGAAGRLLIVDGHAYAYRAFYAIRRLTCPEGRPTNAIYGFIKMLDRMRAALQPSRIIVVWDGGLAEERTALLPEYKMQRPDMPDDLEEQLDGMVAYLEAAGICSQCFPGVEADDWIATLARQAVEEGVEVVIASADKDFMQLVGPSVFLFNPNDKSEALWGPDQVRGKTGVAPGQIVDWLSLIGDTVDNIPGVQGVGPKTAADLLARFGSLERIYAQISEIKSERLKTSLAAAAGAVWRNRELIRLKDDLPGDSSASGPVASPEDPERLCKLFRQWGFETMLQEMERRARALELF